MPHSIFSIELNACWTSLPAIQKNVSNIIGMSIPSMGTFIESFRVNQKIDIIHRIHLNF